MSAHSRTGTIASIVVALALAAGLAAGCGSDEGAADGSAGTTPAPDTAGPDTDTTATTGGPGTTAGSDTTASTDGSGTTASAPVTLEQPAIWPAADVVFDTPEKAAESFVDEVLEVPVNLGDFQQGDGRSGEMEVQFLGEGASGPPIGRGLLTLRQLGPDDGWFVLAAVNDNAAITSLDYGDEVPAGPFTVEGLGRGFEGAVTVTAFIAGDATPLDQALAQGGAMADPEPFEVTVDLSDAEPGSVVVLLVRGGVGLETDPGDFGALPVVVAR